MRIALLTAAAIAVLLAGCGPADEPATDPATDPANEVAADAQAMGQGADDALEEASVDVSSAENESDADLDEDAETSTGTEETDSGAGETAREIGDTGTGDDGDTSDADADSSPDPTPDPTLQAFYSNFQPPMVGDPAAPVTILEFSDYLCPYCGVYAGDTSHQIEEEYVDDGRVSMVFIDFPIPGHGYPAMISHEAAHCASEQDAYWPMHYALFAQQEQLIDLGPRDEEAAKPVVVAIAEEIGLDGDAIAACIDSQIYRPIIGSLSDQAQQRGINVTPTLLIMSASPDGEVRNEAVAGYLPMEDFRPYLERALSHSQGTPVPDPVTEEED